ncbi:reprolysin-like metallopeptidase [Chryseobacterium sp.]|uniref:reprolysin-like metallopeptidase n=1 Tax=Chryseobacterium sp. TaxID=1871047 RepID=UPI00321A316B
MNKKIRPFLVGVFATVASSQMVYAQRGFFKSISNDETTAKVKSTSVENLKKYSVLEMDRSGLKNYLAKTPSTGKYTTPGISLEIPLPNGKTETFIIQEASILTPEVQALHTDIRTYKGKGTQNPGYKIRLSLTPEGFDAIILGVGGDAVIIEKIKNTNNLYKSYFSKDALMPAKPASQSRCGTGSDQTLLSRKLSGKAKNLQSGKFSNGNEIKKFRLAIAATGEYTAAFGGGNASAAFATIVAYVNEVNAVYEAELGVNFQLVSSTNVVYTNPATDPYTANNQITMLDENQANLDNVIGNSNYDIGHVFGAGGSGSGGGIASSPSLCDDFYKGSGVSDIGDEVYYARVFSIQLIAHEIGHQFGMSHSYNSNIPVCTTRRYTTSVEPGSGATVMSYGFTCSNNNPADGVVGDDDYSNDYIGGKKVGPFLNFHTASIKQALDYISTLSCYTTISSGNAVPVINPIQASYTIPKSTPFYLKATAYDANNDPLSYSWEGTNISDLQDVTGGNGNPTAPPSLDGSILEDTTHPPFFRSYQPVTSGTDPGLRYYPLLSAVLAGTNYSRGDKLPSVAYNTTHTLSVRDGNGGMATQDVTVKVDNSGPFLITNDPSGSYTAGSSLPVTWSVNGTNNAPVNCKLVDVWLSTDGGTTFTVLASAIPNSGSAAVTLPNIATTQARIKVTPSTSTASGNVPSVFFDISNTDFAIQNAACIPYTGQLMTSGNTYCLNGNLTVGSNITIPHEATLIIQSGQLQSVDIQVRGNLEINDGASVKSTGSITIGVHGSNKNSKVKLGTKSFLSLTGSVSQGDPSFGGFYPGVTSIIEMGTSSVVEICGTFTQQATTYPFIKYVGLPTGKAYCIAKADVSGGGAGSVLSNNSQIIAIAMGSVTSISAGAASFCGPNATKAMCSALWPNGLSEDKSSCGNAPDIVDKINTFCTKPGATGTPTDITRFGITVQDKANGWPEKVPNGFIAMESKNKGFVITRVQHVSQTPQPGDSVADPKEGMILYDMQDKCVKLYNGTEWKCVQRSCND